jgi:hypothetical protein
MAQHIPGAKLIELSGEDIRHGLVIVTHSLMKWSNS